MMQAIRMALPTIGMLLSAAAFADDAKLTDTDREPRPETMLSVEALRAELAYASRWQLYDPIEPIAYSDDWPRSIPDLDFQDDSFVARVSKLRNLSLLTLVEAGKTRLFLGVNDDGLVGIHFKAFPNDADERYMEVVRMPYLNENESDGLAHQSGPAAK